MRLKLTLQMAQHVLQRLSEYSQVCKCFRYCRTTKVKGQRKPYTHGIIVHSQQINYLTGSCTELRVSPPRSNKACRFWFSACRSWTHRWICSSSRAFSWLQLLSFSSSILRRRSVSLCATSSCSTTFCVSCHHKLDGVSFTTPLRPPTLPTEDSLLCFLNLSPVFLQPLVLGLVLLSQCLAHGRQQGLLLSLPSTAVSLHLLHSLQR